MISYSSLAIQRADDLRSKALIPLVQFGDARIKDPLSGMPPAADELFKDATPEVSTASGLAEALHVVSSVCFATRHGHEDA